MVGVLCDSSIDCSSRQLEGFHWILGITLFLVIKIINITIFLFGHSVSRIYDIKGHCGRWLRCSTNNSLKQYTQIEAHELSTFKPLPWAHLPFPKTFLGEIRNLHLDAVLHIKTQTCQSFVSKDYQLNLFHPRPPSFLRVQVARLLIQDILASGITPKLEPFQSVLRARSDIHSTLCFRFLAYLLPAKNLREENFCTLCEMTTETNITWINSEIVY